MEQTLMCGNINLHPVFGHWLIRSQHAHHHHLNHSVSMCQFPRLAVSFVSGNVQIGMEE